MKAVAVNPTLREITVREHPEPSLASPTAVLARPLEVGVCGTDREIASFAYGVPPAGESWLVNGHECLAEVVQVGAAVENLRPGDLVVLTVRRPCPHPECRPCRAGRQDFCTTGDFTERGIKGAHGYMTERVVDDAGFFVPLPAALREIGVLTEPLTIAEKAIEQVRAIETRLPESARHSTENPKRAVVLGAGPVGLLGAMVLRLAGYTTFVYSRSARDDVHGPILSTIGATLVAAETQSVSDLADTVGNIDLVYEAVGASSLAFEVLKFLGVNAVFVFTGVPGRKEAVKLDTDRVMRHLVLKNQVAFGTVNAGRESFAAAVRDLGEFATRWPTAVRGLITSRSPLEAAPTLLTTKPGGIKSVVAIGG